ncbi:hypothetical protein RF11_08560 [Thelohanellus kitauei]|uniref:Uncharacterized protein n=1 Tax=Thelohanellus kitauei TaxID=669202 RepID=A0A0C2I8Y0_THEKT|nr:hypothetical protein RF11_08560 [Thelohanellus kitauei]
MLTSDIGFLYMPMNPIDLSRQFLRSCSTDTLNSKILNDQRFSHTVIDLIRCDREEVLIPTLMGLRKITADSNICNVLRNDTTFMRLLNDLSKKSFGNDQMYPMVSEIMGNLNPEDSQLNSSLFSQKINHKVSMTKRFDRVRMREFSTLKYIIEVPGIKNTSTRKRVENLLFKIKGIKSFQMDPRNEIEFRLSLFAKILSVHAHIFNISLIKSDAGAEQKTKIEPEDYDLDTSNFSTNESPPEFHGMLVDPEKQKLGWTTSIGNFLSKVLYW